MNEVGGENERPEGHREPGRRCITRHIVALSAGCHQTYEREDGTEFAHAALGGLCDARDHLPVSSQTLTCEWVHLYHVVTQQPTSVPLIAKLRASSEQTGQGYTYT